MAGLWRAAGALWKRLAQRLFTARVQTGGLFSRPSPWVDRLLADAVRIAELPSPTNGEETRVTWLVERLKALSLPWYIDGAGNVLVSFSGSNAPDERPCLFFAFLGSNRWDPLLSLARLDPGHARGAGLSDAVPPAALIALAEALSSGELACERDCQLLFLAHSAASFTGPSFEAYTGASQRSPLCALGLESFSLGHYCSRGLGTWRFRVAIHCGPGQSAVDQTVLLAQKLLGVRWDASGNTRCHIRKLRAGAGFAKPALEGLVDLELESNDQSTLDLAKEAVLATAKTLESSDSVAVTNSELAFVPPGNAQVNAVLVEALKAVCRELHIPPMEEERVDTASWFSARGIPALSLALAIGEEGVEEDVLDISSLETGRRLLIALARRVQSLDSGPGAPDAKEGQR